MSSSFDRLVAIMDRLRDPGGCPWDREQTIHSLAPYFLEEASEVVDAIASGDPEKLREELGDLLLQIVFVARIARENGWFDIDGVSEGISEKMVRRHPHVFGDRQVEGSAEVMRNWEDIKKEERSGKPDASVLDGVPGSLPALLKAFRMTEKAAAVGFDWRKPIDVMDKMREEMGELEAELDADDGVVDDRVRAEMGDVLFVMANLARHLGVEPETALQQTNTTFLRRFQAMEDRARQTSRDFRQMDLAEQDALWNEVKADEGDERPGSELKR
ncbi:MAG: nucleoside triphosphate pyrophosphohydrolase [Acidobacteriota bacterium]|nr:nucleoside triphosphate pyrophosphohydrolase [Acidobacteriota bacterium]